MQIKVEFTGSFGSLKVFECHEYEGKQKIGCKIININPLKEKGIINRISDIRKAEKYLNTEEGMKFYTEAQHINI